MFIFVSINAFLNTLINFVNIVTWGLNVSVIMTCVQPNNFNGFKLTLPVQSLLLGTNLLKSVKFSEQKCKYSFLYIHPQNYISRLTHLS